MKKFIAWCILVLVFSSAIISSLLFAVGQLGWVNALATFGAVVLIVGTAIGTFWALETVSK